MVDLRELFTNLAGADEKVVLKLLAALKDGQQSDFDYLKFKLSYLRLQQMGMDESQASKSAFLTASTMGFTKEKLITSAKSYQSVLNKEKEIFANALKYQIAQNVDGKRVEINNAREKIVENLRKIEKLQEENKLLEEHAKQIESGLDSIVNKIDETRDRFKKSFDLLYKEIEDDLVLYNKFL